MILRAAFWIGLVSLLMPHEPDLGPGHPGAGTGLPSSANSPAASGLSRPDRVCGDRDGACAGGLNFLESFQGQALNGLATVKAEIEADRKARAAKGV